MPGEAAMPHDASAFELILSGDPALITIVRLSLIVSLSAVAGAALIGLPVGALVVLNALMGLPPVVVGLAVYLLLSRSGPLGSWGLLFTPQAMIVAQTVLITPIIAPPPRSARSSSWAAISTASPAP